jgi:hypothetical protein
MNRDDFICRCIDQRRVESTVSTTNNTESMLSVNNVEEANNELEQDDIDDLEDAEWLRNSLDAFHLEDDSL